MVKARIQAYSPALPVGAQHYYKGSFDALRTILKSDGILGLWRGVNAAILRTAMVSSSAPPQLPCTCSRTVQLILQGSSVQLPSYNLGKKYLISWGWKENGYSTYLVASGVSGFCVCAAMQ
jgi:solute carrier family 25 protein 34/35